MTSALSLVRKDVPETINIPAEFLPDPGNVYALRVVGDCMDDGGPDAIRDGDIVLVDPDEAVADGDVAIVLFTWEGVRGRALKRVTAGGRVLVPANPVYAPMVLGPEADPVVQGRVIGRLRVIN